MQRLLTLHVVLGVQEAYAQAALQQCTLTQNYRSRPSILEVGKAVLRASPGVIEKVLVPAKEMDGATVQLWEAGGGLVQDSLGSGSFCYQIKVYNGG